MSLTIGQRLRKEREARYISIERASDETRIRKIFLQALESDDYSVMPSAAQGRGFLRNYAAYLDINIDEVIAEMQKNVAESAEVSGPLPQVNLAETEIPPLTESQEEEKPRHSWTSWLNRPKQADSAPEPVLPSPAPEETNLPAINIEEIEVPKKTTRRKKKVEIEPEPQLSIVEPAPVEETIPVETIEPQEMPVEAEPVQVKDEAQVSVLNKLLALIPNRKAKEQTEVPSHEIDVTTTATPVSSEAADVIFAEIGKQLRERRELISLTIEEVERHTKLRPVFIKAMEAGDFDKLPSPVQTRGMLVNYATFLDLDPDAVLLRFADSLQARRREKYSETPRDKIQTEVKASIPFWRGFIASDLIFGMGMIAIILALAVWGIGRVMNSQATKAQPTALSIVQVLADVPLDTPQADQTFVPVDETSVATGVAGEAGVATSTPNLNANVAIDLFAVERTFIRVSVDGEVKFEGRIAPLETQHYEAENQIEVLAGNAAAIRVTYNSRDLGLLGNLGEVVSRVYTISGIVTPTATIPPTPTNTPLVTNTPTATVTPTPTAVETPTP
ncbi:MAG: DUF4115 domain-containing protein [Anaerolineales bacterium]